MDEIKVRMIKEGGFPVNEELAGLVPMAMESEQLALTLDIKEHGQRDPIILWKGEVVDGRCRQKALVSLGFHILYRELSSDLTKEEVAVFVKSVNTRRNLTMTQKIMSACKESMKPNSKSIAKIAESWGISVGILNNARYIANTRPDFIAPLFNGSTVTIANSKGEEIQSNKITAIYAYLKKLEETVSEDTSYGWKADASIQTQAGKEWYYDIVSMIGIADNVMIKMALAELANYKFVMPNDPE